MKISEFIKAVDNNAIVDDKDDAYDVLVLIQDTQKDKDGKITIRGYINGYDDRLASMLADRMVKNSDFLNIVNTATRLFLAYKAKELGIQFSGTPEGDK